ncbi:hypothetical protein C8R43DRAFT_956956 [Mycena crocata]|nr:hypothetical protein C8R43DRAFT_956956 [Mycena crocata]
MGLQRSNCGGKPAEGGPRGLTRGGWAACETLQRCQYASSAAGFDLQRIGRASSTTGFNPWLSVPGRSAAGFCLRCLRPGNALQGRCSGGRRRVGETGRYEGDRQMSGKTAQREFDENRTERKQDAPRAGNPEERRPDGKHLGDRPAVHCLRAYHGRDGPAAGARGRIAAAVRLHWKHLGDRPEVICPRAHRRRDWPSASRVRGSPCSELVLAAELVRQAKIDGRGTSRPDVNGAGDTVTVRGLSAASGWVWNQPARDGASVVCLRIDATIIPPYHELVVLDPALVEMVVVAGKMAQRDGPHEQDRAGNRDGVRAAGTQAAVWATPVYVRESSSGTALASRGVVAWWCGGEKGGRRRPADESRRGWARSDSSAPASRRDATAHEAPRGLTRGASSTGAPLQELACSMWRAEISLQRCGRAHIAAGLGAGDFGSGFVWRDGARETAGGADGTGGCARGLGAAETVPRRDGHGRDGMRGTAAGDGAIERGDWAPARRETENGPRDWVEGEVGCEANTSKRDWKRTHLNLRDSDSRRGVELAGGRRDHGCCRCVSVWHGGVAGRVGAGDSGSVNGGGGRKTAGERRPCTCRKVSAPAAVQRKDVPRHRSHA